MCVVSVFIISISLSLVFNYNKNKGDFEPVLQKKAVCEQEYQTQNQANAVFDEIVMILAHGFLSLFFVFLLQCG